MSQSSSCARVVAFLSAGGTVLLWGASFSAIRIALDHLDPAPLAAVRFAAAGLAFVVLLAVLRPPRIRGADWVRAALGGATGIALYNILSNSGQTTISAGAASFMVNTQPILVAALASLTLNERFGRLAWIGSAVALAGVVAIAAGQPGGLRFGSGASLLALAALCSAMSFVLQRPLVARYGALTSAAVTILMGALLLSPWLVRGLVQVAAAPPMAWGAVAFLALGSGVIGYLLWMRALDHFGAARASSFLYLLPPWATLLDWCLGSAGPTPSTWLGGAAVLAGVALVQRRHTARPSNEPVRPAGIIIGRREVLIGAAAVGMQGVMPGCAPTALPRPRQRDAAVAVLDTVVEQMLSESPETATSAGMDVGARAALRGMLSDRSWDAVSEQQARTVATVERLRRLDRDALSPELAAARDVALYSHELAADGAAFAFGDHTIHAAVAQTVSPYVVSQMTGSFFHVPEFLNTEHPIATELDEEAYLARLSAFAGMLDAENERIASDRASGIVPPSFILDVVLQQMDRYLATPARDLVLVQSLVRRCAQHGIPGDMEARALRLVETAVLPALERQRQELVTSRARATDAAGVRHLSDGEGYYAWHLRVATTTSLSADEIHALGVDSSHAIESRMDELLRSQGLHGGSVGERMSALGRDPRFLLPNDDAGRTAALAHVEALIEGVRARMAELSRLPLRADVLVRRVPVEIEAGAAGAYVAPGSLDGARPAHYWLNLRDTAAWPSWALRTLTYHEALPGHVWQEAYGIERSPWHPVRALLRFNAYSEGWALYAERLADELGWYSDDPFGQLGYLQAQQLRASRLVVDTGLHARGWSRDQAIDSMVRMTGRERAAMASEVDRYCVKPGQACGYMIGCTELLRLRDRVTRSRSGGELRAFNDAVVTAGNTPLSLLETSVERALRRARGQAGLLP
jgi:uncharacterized protein (DUF885 family)/drug/metabolite transporter (DMT)-like permease